LLLDLAQGLLHAHPDSAGPWVFIAEVPDPSVASSPSLSSPSGAASDVDHPPLVWLAIADLEPVTDDGPARAVSQTVSRIVPRPGPEQLFATADAALVALQDHLAITEIAGLAVRWFPAGSVATPDHTHRGAMIDGFAHIARDLPLHDIALQSGAVAGPVFTPPRRVPVPLLASLCGGAALCAVLVFVAVPLVQELLREPPPPPVPMVTLQPKPGAFAEACLTDLTAWWPRIVGWDVVSTGCAVTGHVPQDLMIASPVADSPLSQPLVIWRRVAARADRNSVLARSAADQAVAAWNPGKSVGNNPEDPGSPDVPPYGAHYDDFGRLILWKTAALPLIESAETTERFERDATVSPEHDDPASDPDDDPDVAIQRWRTRLAVLFADTPDAVTVSPSVPDRTVIITAPGRLRDAFARVAQVSGLTPVRLEQPGDLVVMPIRSRRVPLTAFEHRETDHRETDHRAADQG